MNSALLLAFVLVGAGCQDPGAQPAEDEGMVSLAIATVPEDATCLRVAVQGSREVVRTFTTTPGQAFATTLTTLPTGPVTLLLAAFPVACSALTPATEATWMSEPVSLSLVRGVPVPIKVLMRQNGRINLDVEWDIDGGAPMCMAGTANCDGSPANGCEVNLANDPNHCGQCGVVCARGVNGAPVCRNGACGVVCNAGFGDCDGNAANGCETALSDSQFNCGRCGAVCFSSPNGTPVCRNGACESVCTPGFSDCDGNAFNGCETLLDSPINCGRCGVVCIAGPNGRPVCGGGTCQVMCNAGFSNCDGDVANGCETRVSDSSSNCGQCGITCAPSQICRTGFCVPAPKPNGSPCAASSECASGFCVDGVCCNTACAGGSSGRCVSCSTAQARGQCAALPLGTVCGTGGTCNDSGQCVGGM